MSCLEITDASLRNIAGN